MVDSASFRAETGSLVSSRALGAQAQAPAPPRVHRTPTPPERTQEVLVGPSGGMSAGSSTALRPPPTLGMHGDHVVKILRTVAVLCSAPPSRALPRHCHAGYRQCRPLLVCPAPRPEHSAKPSPGGKAGGKTVNLADFSPF